jgi:hypothetical protein
MLSCLTEGNLSGYGPPVRNESLEIVGYQRVPDVAQYGGADWSNVVEVARHISLKEAKAIADRNPDINYFFYIKAPSGFAYEKWGYFAQHDAVFFSGDPWWGSAKRDADGYVKLP